MAPPTSVYAEPPADRPSTAIRIEGVSEAFDTAGMPHDLSRDVRAGESLGRSSKTRLPRIVVAPDAPDRDRIDRAALRRSARPDVPLGFQRSLSPAALRRPAPAGGARRLTPRPPLGRALRSAGRGAGEPGVGYRDQVPMGMPSRSSGGRPGAGGRGLRRRALSDRAMPWACASMAGASFRDAKPS